MRHWINTVSLEHVELARVGGFTQADHGRPTRLAQLQRGDRLVFYSPRTAMRSGTPLQQFTAVGEITDDDPYQVEITADFAPWRRRMRFFPAHPAPIRPLLDELSLTRDRPHWGIVFRRGLFQAPEADFEMIAAAMGVGQSG